MKSPAIFVLSILLLQFHLDHIESAKILGVFPTMAKSHDIVGKSIMEALVEAGHEVTVVSPFPQNKPIKNWRDINTDKIIAETQGTMANILDMADQNFLEMLQGLFHLSHKITNVTMALPSFQDLLNSNEEFDVIVMEVFLNEAMLGLGHRFKAPIIGVSTFGSSKWTNEMVGTPAPLSWVPNPFLSFTDRMTFTQRLGNTLAAIFDTLYFNFVYWPMQTKIYNEIFAEPKPDLHTLRTNVSLVLLNTHVSLSTPKPYVPNMIEIGGIQIKRKPGRLPTDLQNVLDNAKNGVIYFSMGSNIKSKLLPVKLRDEILQVFGGLKEQVLWKWEDPDLPGKPDNVYISKWFPQDEVLSHPNVKLFITHGGLLGSTEAIYHGVPLLGFPVFGDQDLNMARAEREGYGISISYKKLNGKLMKAALDKLLSTDLYRKKAKLLSDRYRDQPMTPIETAVYWIEYVIRHKGAPHLRSAGLDLCFISYHNLDVFGLMIATVLVVLFILKWLVCFLFCRQSNKPTKRSKKVKSN